MEFTRKLKNMMHSDLIPQEEIAAPYHFVQIAVEKRSKNEEFWCQKEICTNISKVFHKPINGGFLYSALCEKIGGDLFRLINGIKQPKIKLLSNQNSGAQLKFYILSKLLVNFKMISDCTELLENSSGLASNLLVSLLLDEWDAHPSNFFRSNSILGRIDFEWCFFTSRIADKETFLENKIFTKDLEEFPSLISFKPFCWPIEKRNCKILATNKNFKLEKFITILKVLLIPVNLFTFIIQQSTSDKALEIYKQKIYNHFMERLRMFKSAALESLEFRNFLFTEGWREIEFIKFSLIEYMKEEEIFCHYPIEDYLDAKFKKLILKYSSNFFKLD